jgi:acyl-coenzyme A thioesterase PaaI-like protein
MPDAPEDVPNEPAHPDDSPRARAAAALRRFGHTLMEREADDELLERVVTAAERTIAELETAPRRTRDPVRIKRQFFPQRVAEGERIVHFDECFVSGPWNPLGIGMHAEREGDGVRATVRLGAAFEGAPGRSHGGIVAAIFDDVMGYLLTVHEVPAFTGELTVRYLAPTPMGTELTFRSWLVHRDGRRLVTEAEAVAGERRVATASATFIEVDPARFHP